MPDAKFYPANDEVKRIAADLISRLHPQVKSYDVRILWLFRDQPQVQGGRPCGATITLKKGLDAVLSRVNKPLEEQIPGDVRRDGGAFFVVQIHNEYWSDLEDHAKRALLHHELFHAGVEPMDDGKIKLSIVPHDFERFASEVSIFGAWDTDIEQMMNACAPYIKLQLDKISQEEDDLFERIRKDAGVPVGEDLLRNPVLRNPVLTVHTTGTNA